MPPKVVVLRPIATHTIKLSVSRDVWSVLKTAAGGASVYVVSVVVNVGFVVPVVQARVKVGVVT